MPPSTKPVYIYMYNPVCDLNTFCLHGLLLVYMLGQLTKSIYDKIGKKFTFTCIWVEPSILSTTSLLDNTEYKCFNNIEMSRVNKQTISDKRSTEFCDYSRTAVGITISIHDFFL